MADSVSPGLTTYSFAGDSTAATAFFFAGVAFLAFGATDTSSVLVVVSSDESSLAVAFAVLFVDDLVDLVDFDMEDEVDVVEDLLVEVDDLLVEVEVDLLVDVEVLDGAE